MISISQAKQDRLVPSLISKKDLEQWWTKALCSGIQIDMIFPNLCYECPVMYPCLWTALIEDDRLGESAFFIRGSLPANKRQELWALNDGNAEDTFWAGVMEIERSKRFEETRQKGTRNKQSRKYVQQNNERQTIQ